MSHCESHFLCVQLQQLTEAGISPSLVHRSNQSPRAKSGKIGLATATRKKVVDSSNEGNGPNAKKKKKKSVKHVDEITVDALKEKHKG